MFSLVFSLFQKSVTPSPKSPYFYHEKWDSIPKYSPKYHIKWGLHINIEYNTIGYTPTDIAEGKRLKAYLEQSGQSANSYIKGLIKTDLDGKGVPYNE